MKNLTCFCETEFEADINDVYDLALSKHLEKEILEGSFLSFTCPACGKVLKPELPVRILNTEKSLDVYVLPETERDAYLAGKDIDLPGESKEIPSQYGIVIGYAELAEKIKIIDAGFSPAVVEIIKYFYLKKIKSGSEVIIFFDHEKDDSLFFHIHGLKPDEIGVAAIPRSFYLKVEDDLSKPAADEDYRQIIEPPYISVRKFIIEEED